MAAGPASGGGTICKCVDTLPDSSAAGQVALPHLLTWCSGLLLTLYSLSALNSSVVLARSETSPLRLKQSPSGLLSSPAPPSGQSSGSFPDHTP